MNKRKEETNDSMPSENFQEDAKQFVQTIKEFYADKPKIYQDFLTLVKSFNSKKIKFATIAQRLSEIFQDHPEHIDSFAELMSNEKKQKLKKIAADLRNVVFKILFLCFVFIYCFTNPYYFIFFRLKRAVMKQKGEEKECHQNVILSVFLVMNMSLKKTK